METETLKQEERKFKMHENLLSCFIKKQALTLRKAIQEGTTNSFEAGASAIHINFREENGKAFIQIIDDGIGIKTEEELVHHFETFGTPHDVTENKIMAEFRVGRGQMFSFGKNIWRTSQYEMIVDIDNCGLVYKLTKGLPEVSGCTIDIELYKNPVGTWDCLSIEDFKEKIKNQIRFIKIPVYFNGEQISVNPDSNQLKWSYEDENAYYLFSDSSEMKIYNLGVFVHSLSISAIGVGGYTVSKKKLKVNVSRDSIDYDCPIYKKIYDVIYKNKIKKAQNKYNVLSPEQRLNLLTDIRNGRIENSILGKKILWTSQGKWISINNLVDANVQWTFATPGANAADRIMEKGIAICLSTSILEHFGYESDRKYFFSYLFRQFLLYKNTEHHISKWVSKLNDLYIDFDSNGKNSLMSKFKNETNIIDNTKLNKLELRILYVLNRLCCWNGRDIRFGESDTCLAWTNGCSYIALDRKFVKNLNLKRDIDIQKMFYVLCHEMAHDESTDGTHIHGHEFYENFYEITGKSYNPFIYMMRFREEMCSKKIDEMRAKQAEKEKKEKEKLGIA